MLKHNFRHCLLLVVFSILLISSTAYSKTSNRIVSMAPSITRSLYELGAEKEVVGITTFCPKGTIKKELIGTMWEPVLEKIVALKPTLVIATREGNKKESVEKLRKLGIKVLVQNNADSFDKICSNFNEIAASIDRSNIALVLINDIKSTLYDYKMDTDSKIKVFWQIGVRPLFTTGKKSFVNSFHEYSGGVNIFQDQNKTYFQVNREEVIKRRPDVIFITNMNNSTDDQQGIWEKIPGFNPKIVTLENDAIFTPTPKTFLKGVELIFDQLEKINFKDN